MKKRVVFMGTPYYATKIFEELLSNDFEIVALFTKEDKPVGRKQILTPPHIKQYCIDNNLNIPIFQPKSLRQNEKIVEVIKELNADFIIVAAYGQILPIEILQLAPCINLHASLLPLYRGASPIQESLLKDDTFTGATAMLMNGGLDTGDILGYEYYKVPKDMKVDELFMKLSEVAATLIVDILDKFQNIKPKRQNNSIATLCKKIKKDNGLVNFDNAQEIYLKYRAYYVWPGIFTANGLKLKNIELNEISSINKAGEILEIYSDYIVIGCKEGSLRVKEVQMPSKNTISVDNFLKGQRYVLGDIIS